MKTFLKLFCLVVLLLTVAPEAFTQELVLKEVSPAEYNIDEHAIKKGPEYIRSRYVRLNKKALGEEISLQLFPDVHYSFKKERIEHHKNSSTWVGSVSGTNKGYGIFSFVKGTLAGKVVIDLGAAYLIDEVGESIFLITEVSQTALQEHADDGIIAEEDQEGAHLRTASNNVCDAAAICDPKVIDVMVVYTPAARAQSPLGTNASMEARIATAIAEMNAANTSSGVIHSINLVHCAEVAYVEYPDDTGGDLGRLRNAADGFMDIIHTWRSTYGADLVALIVNSSACGTGYLQTNPTTFNANNGFCVSSYNCMATNRTLTHELGHNLSLRHDTFMDGSTTPCPRHHGYVNQNAVPASPAARRWRTIMAYNNQCSDAAELGGSFNCTRLNRWSNPLQVYDGTYNDPMGIFATADNVYALNRAGCKVADFFNNPLPLIMVSFDATRSGNKNLLRWETSTETNTSHFEVERSTDGLNFETLGYVNATGNSNSLRTYSFTDYTPEQMLYYRLKQVDKDGAYTYSDVKKVYHADHSFSLNIYPQPLRKGEKLNLDLSTSEEDNFTIQLLDLLGNSLLNFSGKQGAHSELFSLDLPHLIPGNYILLFSNSSENRVFKIVVQ